MSSCGVEIICANHNIKCSGCIRCSNWESKNKSKHTVGNGITFGKKELPRENIYKNNKF